MVWGSVLNFLFLFFLVRVKLNERVYIYICSILYRGNIYIVSFVVFKVVGVFVVRGVRNIFWRVMVGIGVI